MGEEKGNVRLDPDAIEDGRKTQMPLSDLYEIPVFAEDTKQRTWELKNKEKRELARIRLKVFSSDTRGETEYLKQVRARLFETAAGYVKTEKVQKTDSRPVQGTVLFAEAAVLGIMVFVLFFQKSRRRKTRTECVNDINDYNG